MPNGVFFPQGFFPLGFFPTGLFQQLGPDPVEGYYLLAAVEQTQSETPATGFFLAAIEQ